MNHRIIPSLSSSVSSQEISNQSPRTSFSSCIDHANYNNKRYSEPQIVTPTRRWDDSQLEMELAEDDLIDRVNKVPQRTTSLRFNKTKLLFHRSSSQHQPLIKKICNWLF
ncbi:MAG: hypothetical protein EXX96DRAFT_645595 [Benjaminiella poitrasii]|nr:MAG: hypothetical protein EXX96DRAFT_645595 [Benjaminiella poitrasii]